MITFAPQGFMIGIYDTISPESESSSHPCSALTVEAYKGHKARTFLAVLVWAMSANRGHVGQMQDFSGMTVSAIAYRQILLHIDKDPP